MRWEPLLRTIRQPTIIVTATLATGGRMIAQVPAKIISALNTIEHLNCRLVSEFALTRSLYAHIVRQSPAGFYNRTAKPVSTIRCLEGSVL